jgi:2-dehydro-3-deoxy-D-arabinonate dehydratase
MHLYRSTQGIIVGNAGAHHLIQDQDWDKLLATPGLHTHLAEAIGRGSVVPAPQPTELLAPIGTQEVWAAGVTYFRSKTARMEESKDAGGGSFYDRVYTATRPEIFFKATAQRVAHPGQTMHLRRDSAWMVPEPELTLVINPQGEIIGYTIGNDLSCRDIEGENPLYLPQAKCFKLCASVGPCLWISPVAPAPQTAIELRIERSGETAFESRTELSQLKRGLPELAEFLYRDNSFPTGALLMTGTGIVPGDDFTLKAGDIIHISIEGIGTLSNPVG